MGTHIESLVDTGTPVCPHTPMYAHTEADAFSEANLTTMFFYLRPVNRQGGYYLGEGGL